MFMLNDVMLFIDGSVHVQSKLGYGAYLAVTETDLSTGSLRASVKVQRFEHTSSTRLELQTLLWALKDIPASVGTLTVYTDSQNIIGLHERREQLEKNNYRSKNDRPLNNSDLYQAFFRITDQFNCTFVKVRGHHLSSEKDAIDRLFTLVDRASRSALRKEVRSKTSY
ncbi:MAG: ribonuclease HI [Pedobacter sp.]